MGSEYSKIEEELSHRLGSYLMSRYEGLRIGVEHVQQVDIEFAVIGVMIKNNRRRLQQADAGIGQGGLYVARQKRRRERLEKVEALLVELHGILEDRNRMRQYAREEKYNEALKLNARLLNTLRSERFEGGGGTNLFSRMREDLRSHFEDIKQTLRERFMRQRSDAGIDGGDFNADHIEELLERLASSGTEPPPHSTQSEWGRRQQQRV